MSDANIICHDVDLLGDWLDSRGYTEEAGLCLRVLGLIHEQAEDNEKLREERHELKNELAKWVNYWRDKDVKALRAENEKLRAAMHDIYEVYAGSEGIPQPVTCSEAYLYDLVREMADIAAKHKRGRHD